MPASCQITVLVVHFIIHLCILSQFMHQMHTLFVQYNAAQQLMLTLPYSNHQYY